MARQTVRNRADFFWSLIGAFLLLSFSVHSVSAVEKPKATPDASAGTTDYALTYSTLLGGAVFDRAQGVFVDNQGFIYLGGNTSSANFPTTMGAFDRSKNGPSGKGIDTSDGFVAKFSPTGKLLWLTLLGGSRRDQVYQVRVDASGNVYAVGSTGSSDFLSEAPNGTPGFDQTFNGPTIRNGYGDIFVVKLSSNGSKVLYWTYVGGSSDDTSRGNLALASDGSLYVSGRTNSTDFPIPSGMTPPPFQANKSAGEDVIVFKLSASGTTLEKATYLGGNANESGYGGAFLAPDGKLIVAGGTTSTNFPGTTPGSYGGGQGGAWSRGDGFVAKLSADLSSLDYALYIGGTGNDSVSHNQGMAVDSQGRAVALLLTKTANLMTTNGSTFGGVADAYIVVVAADGSAIERATYFGGTGDDYPSAITVSQQTGYIYFGGRSSSSDYPVTQNAFGTSMRGAHDVVLSILAPDLSTVYSTFLEGAPRGPEDQRGRGIWLGPDGSIVYSGMTTANFPTTSNAYQRNNAGGADAFVVKFSPN